MTDKIQPYPAGQLAFDTLQFIQTWEVVRPRVFRYLPKQFVDEFFEDGSLRLSSFIQFAKHTDEQRKDAAEGKGVRTGLGENLTIVMATGRGSNCYVLCGSMVYSEKMRQTFGGADNCFAIDNTVAFAAAIARALPGFMNGLEGPAIYQDDTTIRRDLGSKTIGDFTSQQPDGSIGLRIGPELQGQVGGYEEFFMKSSRYADQAEYRLLWAVEGQTQDHVTIKAPQARNFCRKLT
jgi:hypothetical protein